MIIRRHINRIIALLLAVLACLATALPLLAQYDEWLQKARQAYQAGNYEQCINNCKIYSSMNGSTNKNKLQVKAERMLACKTAGTLNAYRYMVQYNPNDSWAKEQLKKTLATSDDHQYYVFFTPGEWDFDGSQSAIINDIANAIKGDNNVYKLVGYGVSGDKLDRARRVKKALVEKGIASNRLEDNSFSFGSLAVNNDTHFLTEAVIIEKSSKTAASTTSTTSTQSSSTAKSTININKIWVEHEKQISDGVGMVIHGSCSGLSGNIGDVYCGVCFFENHAEQRKPVYSIMSSRSIQKGINTFDISKSVNYGSLYKKDYNDCVFFVCNEPNSPFDNDFENHVLVRCEIPVQDVKIPDNARFACINSIWIEESKYGRFMCLNCDIIGMDGKEIRLLASKFPEGNMIMSDYTSLTCNAKIWHSDKTTVRISMDDNDKYQSVRITNKSDGSVLAQVEFSKDHQPTVIKK